MDAGNLNSLSYKFMFPLCVMFVFFSYFFVIFMVFVSFVAKSLSDQFAPALLKFSAALLPSARSRRCVVDFVHPTG